MDVPTDFPPPTARPPVRRPRAGARRLGALACVGILAAATPALAEERYGALLFQNDLFLGRDGGGYTNGIYLSGIRIASPGEERIAPGLAGPVASLLGVSHATLTATSFGQGIVTPKDIARRVPDPTDAPYAGFLVLRSAQVARQGETADVVAVSLGLIGPASGAEPVQRAIHRLTGSTTPQGWDTQVSNRPLLGLERARAWRFATSPPTAGAAGADAIVQAGGALGNLESTLGASLLVRYGTGLSRSFPAAVVNGYSVDPFVVGPGWFVFAGVAADRVLNHAGLGDEARLRRERTAGTLGLAYGWSRTSLTFSVRTSDPLVSSSGRQMFGSLTWLMRLE